MREGMQGCEMIALDFALAPVPVAVRYVVAAVPAAVLVAAE